jgi:hypothetical protein
VKPELIKEHCVAVPSPQCNEHKCSRQIPQRQGCFNHLLAITLEDLMYKVGRLLLRATVGSLLLYRQAISPSSTAHLHSVASNQRLKSHLHCHSIFTAQVRMDTISPTIGIHSADCIVAHNHKNSQCKYSS